MLLFFLEVASWLSADSSHACIFILKVPKQNRPSLIGPTGVKIVDFLSLEEFYRILKELDTSIIDGNFMDFFLFIKTERRDSHPLTTTKKIRCK